MPILTHSVQLAYIIIYICVCMLVIMFVWNVLFLYKKWKHCFSDAFFVVSFTLRTAVVDMILPFLYRFVKILIMCPQSQLRVHALLSFAFHHSGTFLIKCIEVYVIHMYPKSNKRYITMEPPYRYKQKIKCFRNTCIYIF